MKRERTSLLIKYALLFCVLCSLTQCGKPHVIDVISQYPSWFLKKPQDKDRMYGVGEGFDQKTAQENALRDIAAQLHTIISYDATSQILTLNSGNNRYDNRSSSHNTKITVPPTAFTKYTVVESSTLPGGKFVALLSIEIKHFIQDHRQHIERLITEMNQIYAANADKDLLTQYGAMLKILNIGKQAHEHIQIISSLADTEITRGNLATINDFKDKSTKILGSITIMIQCTDQQIHSTFTNALHRYGIKHLSSNNDSQDPSMITLYLEPQYSEQMIQDVYWVKTSVKIRAKNSNNVYIYGNEITVSGNSVSSYEDAKNAATISLKDQLLKMGLARALGIENDTDNNPKEWSAN